MENVGYTIGIYFDKKVQRVALILKKRPKWQKGMYNFPGGHIEKNETVQQCVAREFKEECLLKTRPIEWIEIGRISGIDYYVNILLCIQRDEHGELSTGEDQKVSWEWINGLPDNCIQNVYWITYYALDIYTQYTNGQQKEVLSPNNQFNYVGR